MKERNLFKRTDISSIAIFNMALMLFIWINISILFGNELNSSNNEAGEIVKREIGKKLDDYLMRIIPFGFSGALLVAKDGKIILNKGYGLAIRSENVPNTSETVFSTGSITKQFTAAGIMKLEMQGKLNTEDSIAKYFENVPEEKKGITLHHLLTHTAGVVDSIGMDYERAQRDDTMKKILDEPLLFQPGERFQYSNSGYSMLAAIIEKVSGKSYEDFLNEHLFKPAGMQFTGYRIPEWNKKVVAHWYVGDKDNRTPLEKPYPYWNLLGNGGILSTTLDMYKWHLALLDDKVLSAKAKKKIFTPFLNDYGYGWDVLDTRRGTLIQHDGGSMLGNNAELRRYMDADVVTILFCNQSYGRGALMGVVRDKIEALVFGGNIAVPSAGKALENKKLLMYEGTYKLPNGDHLQVQAKEGKLAIQAMGQDAISALFSLAKPSANLYRELNDLSVSIFEAALKNDYKPFEKVLFNRGRRLKGVRDFIGMRLNRYRERTGEIEKVIAVATFPSHLNGQESALTYVQLEGERGSIFFGLYWKDKMNIGVSPVMSVPGFSIPFLSTSSHEFAGYHLEMAKNFRIRFDVNDRGSVNGLIIPSKDGDIYLSIVNKQSVL